jgi:hypothetical protein
MMISAVIICPKLEAQHRNEVARMKNSVFIVFGFTDF